MQTIHSTAIAALSYMDYLHTCGFTFTYEQRNAAHIVTVH